VGDSLFRKEIYLTYRRIQDIHVTRNFVQRWLGLAQVSVQTASGSAGAEMTIEGIRKPELLRDFLYQQMRGVQESVDETSDTVLGEDDSDEALKLLREIHHELCALRQSWETSS